MSYLKLATGSICLVVLFGLVTLRPLGAITYLVWLTSGHTLEQATPAALAHAGK